MNERRSIKTRASEMTCEAIHRRLLLVVTVHAKPHGEVDITRRHGALRDVAVAGGAPDLGADMGRVIETDVRGRRISVHALPDKVLAALAHGGDLLNPRPIGGNRVVADHAGADTRQSGDGAGADRFVAVLRTGDLLAGVDVVRELEGLLRFGPPVEELGGGHAYRRTRGREHRTALSRQEWSRGR